MFLCLKKLIVQIIHDGIDSRQTFLYLLNLAFLLRQPLLDGIHCFQQFGGIVLADLLSESGLLILQPHNLVVLVL